MKIKILIKCTHALVPVKITFQITKICKRVNCCNSFNYSSFLSSLLMKEDNLKTGFSVFQQISVNNLRLRVHGEHITMSFLIYKSWKSVQGLKLNSIWKEGNVSYPICFKRYPAASTAWPTNLLQELQVSVLLCLQSLNLAMVHL